MKQCFVKTELRKPQAALTRFPPTRLGTDLSISVTIAADSPHRFAQSPCVLMLALWESNPPIHLDHIGIKPTLTPTRMETARLGDKSQY
jgi:hypothetical protein